MDNKTKWIVGISSILVIGVIAVHLRKKIETKSKRQELADKWVKSAKELGFNNDSDIKAFSNRILNELSDDEIDALYEFVQNPYSVVTDKDTFAKVKTLISKYGMNK